MSDLMAERAVLLRAVSALQSEVEALRAERDRAVAAERERAARVCDDEARIRTEAGQQHPEGSARQSRCFAAARAALNCAKGVRNGEDPARKEG